MADPKTKIIISAVDQTKAAFTSARRNLSDLAGAGDKIGKSFGGIGSALSGLTGLGGLTALLSGGGLIAAVKNVSDAADAMGKLSQKTGIAVEDLSRLDYAASLSDVTTDQLSTGLAKLAKAMADTAAGTGEAKPAFDALGLTQDILAGKFRNAGELLTAVADRMARYEDGANKSALAQKIFGESGAAMIPLLNAGADGLREMGDEAERLGLVMSGDLAKKAEEFNDNLTRLQGLARAVGIDIGNVLIPSLNELAEEFLDARAAGLTFWEALSGIGTSNPFKSPADHVARLTSDLERLKNGKWWDRSVFEAIGGKDLIGQMERELDYWRRRLTGGDVRDPRDRAAGEAANARPEAPRLPEKSGKGGKGSAGGKSRGSEPDPLGDFLREVEADAKAAESAIARFRDIQLDAAVAGAELTKAERQFYDLMNSPDWERMPESFRELVRQEFEAANAAQRAADAQERLNALLNDPAVEQQRADMQLLAKVYEEGKLGIVGSAEAMERFNEVATRVLGNVQEASSKTNDEMSEFSKQSARNMQDAFADFLFDPFAGGLDGMVDGFANALRRMAAEAAAAQILNSLGKAAGSSGWEGFVGSLITGFMGGGGTQAPAPVAEATVIPVQSAKGNAFSGDGLVSAFANGGAFGAGEVLTRPTLFRFAAGGAFRTGVAGEAGPEGALPLKRMRNGKLGVYADGGAAPAANVTQVFNISTPDPNAFRMSERQISRRARMGLQR